MNITGADSLPSTPLDGRGNNSSYFAEVLAAPSEGLRTFDAFPKTPSTYKERTSRGGVLTIVVAVVVSLLVWKEWSEWWYGEPDFSFAVDSGIGHELQINFDATIATPCHFLTVDVRDAVGDRLHISDEFKKDGTTFEIGQAQRLKTLRNRDDLSASRMVHDAASGGWFGRKFAKTSHLVENGPACRVYGSMPVKKVTGNLHITTLGHGYLSWEHTDHALMNLSHVIHEFSFGPYFPRIIQPLDNSAEITPAHFHIFQYFLSVISTTYIDAGRRLLQTSQYSVTDMSRQTEHGKGVPGIFFKYDIEPMALTIRERTTSFVQFLVRLVGIIGGIVVCSDFGIRTFTFLETKALGGDKASPPIPVAIQSPPPPGSSRTPHMSSFASPLLMTSPLLGSSQQEPRTRSFSLGGDRRDL